MTQEELQAHAQALHDAFEPLARRVRLAVPGAATSLRVGPVDRFQQGPARALLECENPANGCHVVFFEVDAVRPDDVGPYIDYLAGGDRPHEPPPRELEDPP